MRLGLHLTAALVLLFHPLAVQAQQGSQIAFGAGDYDNSLPVEVNADRLDLDQSSGAATFTGNGIVGEGDLRLTGDVVDVEYATEGPGQIERLHARGSVTLATGAETAEANEAVYTIASGLVVLTGDLILSQGDNALAGEKLTVRLDDGTGVMEGRVRVIVRPQQEPQEGTSQ